MSERIFLMFDYESTGLWHPTDDGAGRAAGVIDADVLAVSRQTKARLAAWVKACDELNMREFASGFGSAPTAAEREATEAETIALWRALRAEAGPNGRSA